MIWKKLEPHERDQFMNLDESQRKRVTEWIGQGLKLSEIQGRLGSELGLTMTYMEVRLLVDDLKLTPKDIERPKTPQTGLASPPAPSNPPAPAAASKPIAETSTDRTCASRRRCLRHGRSSGTARSAGQWKSNFQRWQPCGLVSGPNRTAGPVTSTAWVSAATRRRAAVPERARSGAQQNGNVVPC